MKSRTALLQVSLAVLAAALAAGTQRKTSAGVMGPESRQFGDDAELGVQNPDSGAHATETQTMMTAAQEGPPMQGGPGRFFQYAHQDDKDHYENGFRRGSEKTFIERHEKGLPKHGHFVAKVRWGDKNGGYGEHYWDFNHHGGPDDHGHGGHGSAPVPDFVAQDAAEEGVPTYKRMQQSQDQSGAQSAMETASSVTSPTGAEPMGRRTYRKKYVRPAPTSALPTHPVPRPRTTARPQPRHSQSPPPPPPPQAPTAPTGPATGKSTKSLAASAEFPSASSLFQKEAAMAAAIEPRMPRETLVPQQAPKPKARHGAASVARKLAFDPRSGRVHDEDTGQVFVLQPVS